MTLTKKGTIRKRRRYNLPLAKRRELKIKETREAHAVRPPCNNCKRKCNTVIFSAQREKINNEFWRMTWEDKRNFILNTTHSEIPERKTENSKRSQTFLYYLQDEQGLLQRVCKIFYLSTLGYKKTNDKIIYSVWTKARNIPPGAIEDCIKIEPTDDVDSSS